MKTIKKRLTREESQHQTRERLIETARQLFIVGGYGGTSIRDIASQAGYSQGAFYSNFASKEDLLLQLLQRHMETEAAQLTSLTQSHTDSTEQVLAALEAWSATLNLEADWCMLSIELQLHAQRSPAFAVEYQKVWDVHQAKIGAVIGSLFQQVGKTPPAEPNELAAAFMAMAHGLALQRTGVGADPSGRLIMLFLRSLLWMPTAG
ncbi:TetR/AcrR family transcriptional regulator [Serratia proteamaculans]|jgi:AcrR family transcriptional regulator|uniref:TetR/AcrR family transcriptional regulator n=1 Tax=Serratia proteamaculans TaxID=28151 RepID=UPI0021783A41|nr:TetR/AcrR family transcriptional regulator [Serratia proteamaculans]CAI0879745.1 HTH-type transcriptional repressor nemR [Serratia proteamaculans]CAI1526840.1 HTH-type transcriptional repressor nemR [Serratia proteamaculans]CAI1628597.1 HTH-type transcriptional repressor nemR [Serratia proteamaculans]CAI1628665.1 HTH-type transcriptional repressor nemR [Serratia proteamaculans]CAI1798970.1 HTH-type transcriptional repressor nemR [Serratia proteamaculans]